MAKADLWFIAVNGREGLCYPFKLKRGGFLFVSTQKAGSDPFKRVILLDPTDKGAASQSNYANNYLEITNMNNKTFATAIGTIISINVCISF